MPGPSQEGRRIRHQVGRQGHDHVVDRRAAGKGVNAALENGAPPQREQLLRLASAEAQAAATGRDDGGNVQGVGGQGLLILIPDPAR
jgi:hypothetical protein